MRASRPKILVVDDSESARRAQSGLLRQIGGFDICVADNGRDAMDRACRERPDVILMDVLMPGMNGFEVCRRLEGNPDTAPIPVIFVTLLEGGEYVDAGFACGCADYLTKPVQIDNLRSKLAALIGDDG